MLVAFLGFINKYNEVCMAGRIAKFLYYCVVVSAV
jgi:hypothetical protein